MITKEYLTEQGIPEDKHENLLKAHTAALTEKEDLWKLDKANAVKSMADGMDKVAREKFGIEKLANERTSDYLIRVAQEAKANEFSTTIQEKETLISDLNEKIKQGIKDPELKKQIESLQNTLNAEREDWKTKDEKYKSEFDNYKTEQVLKSALPKLKSEVDKEFADYKINQTIKGLFENYEIKKDEKGNILLNGNESVGHRQISLEEYYKESLKGVIDEGNTQNGTGFEGRSPQGGEGLDIVDSDTPQIKESKIRDYLAKQGIQKTQKEYTEKFQELRKKYILKK